MSVEAPAKPATGEVRARPSVESRLREILGDGDGPAGGGSADDRSGSAAVEKPTPNGTAPVAAEAAESSTEAPADETAPTGSATEAGTETTEAAESTGASEAAAEGNESAEQIRRLSAELAEIKTLLMRGAAPAPAASSTPAPTPREIAKLPADVQTAWNERIAAGDHLGAVGIVAEARAEAKFRALVEEAREQAEVNEFKAKHPDFEALRPAMKAKHDEIMSRGYLTPEEIRMLVVRPGPKASAPPASAVAAAKGAAASAALARKAPVASAGARPASAGAAAPNRQAAPPAPNAELAEYLKKQRTATERLFGK